MESYRVLLIGIDAYPVRPLAGCVNDIDAIQEVLLTNAGIPPDRIRRLASPRAGARHSAAIPERPASLANIRAELDALASDGVSENDRVLVYYSGHGARAAVAGPEGAYYREALVPVDVGDGDAQLLFDAELNQKLAAITARTRMVSVFLDCCHSLGATRDASGPGRATRVLDLAKDLGRTRPVTMPRSATGDGGAGIGAVDHCQVVAACFDHELAQEDDDAAGRRQGLLTRALVSQLRRLEGEAIRTIRWSHVWAKTSGAVESANPAQHPWLIGSYARPVLGGPAIERDDGIGLEKTGPNEYRIDAGTLADVGEGAQLAVYGETPAYFPDLGSPVDRDARIGPVLRVTSAERMRAVARSEGEPFDLPPGARARVVVPAERVGCAVVPPDASLATALAASPLISVAPPGAAEVRLERGETGLWSLADTINGAAPEYPPLVTLPDADPPIPRRVVEHYVTYSRPLRMAARCQDLPGQLRMKLLMCPEDGLEADVAQTTPLAAATGHPIFTHALQLGDTFCVEIRNASIRQLRVALVNCAASGRVEYLGDQIIEARAYYRFWLQAMQGNPFVVSKAGSKSRYVDRMVAIGTTRLTADLRFLRSNIRFEDLLTVTRDVGEKDIDASKSTGPRADRWTATQLTLGVGLPA
jgi:hypothetical protein